MFGKRYHLFTLVGFRVWIDATWLLLAALIVWSLAVGVFPARYPGLPPFVYLLMGIGGAVGLLLSIVAHELAHSLVARRFGIPMRGITLFVFGGVAEMSEEPRRPGAEFLMAVVGPLSSFVLGVLMLLAAALQPASPVLGLVGYLGEINLLLAVFNLVPAFPLDGGRLLRSALWRWRGDFDWATRLAAWVGQAFGLLLMGAGAVWFVLGHFVGGVWWFVIGLFLRNAARSSYHQVLVRRVLAGETVRRFMRQDLVTVARGTTVARMVDDYVYRFGYAMYPVTDGERLVGCVTTAQLKDVPRRNWETTTVGVVASPCTPENTVAPDLDVMQAVETMSRTGAARLLVAEGERLVGVVTLKDLLRFFSLKMDLEPEGLLPGGGDRGAPAPPRPGSWPNQPGSWQPH